MKKNTTKPSAIIFLILFSTSIFANKTPNYPKGFSPKTNSSISFTENKGQMHDQNYKSQPDVLFGGSDGNLVFHLKNNGISYQLNRVDTWKKESDLSTKKAGFENAEAETKIVADQTTIYRIDINWLNANTNAELIKEKPLDGFNNYYLENCPNGALNVKSYQQITYQNIYDGIDLKWYEKDGRLEYDYLVSAGADYKQIQLEIKGADKLALNNKGELIYKTPLGDIIEQAPLVKQNGNTLKSKWIIKNNILSFEIENINKNQAFIIDPVVRTWGTYYGGNLGDEAKSCATDASGNVYMAGTSRSSTGIATTGSHQSANLYFDAFLVKFNSAGIRQWGTYYGGSGGYDQGNSCATDASGNVYMAGQTDTPSGTSIATLGSHQSNYGGGVSGTYDAFLVKFNSAGIRQWGTYYGGTGEERGESCATDTSGNIFMAGYAGYIPLASGTVIATGTIIATSGSHQYAFGTPPLSGGSDAFLVKFNSAGIRQWGTYYGGVGGDAGNSCATDASGNVFMAGVAADSGTNTIIATNGSHQSAFGGGTEDGFLVKFDPAGVRLWGTYYGGVSIQSNWLEELNSCATDAAGNVYIAGVTNSSINIATPGSHQSTLSVYTGTCNGCGISYPDAYLVKFNSAGVRQWGTYYGGGNSIEKGYSCATAWGNVYLAGSASGYTSLATSTIITYPDWEHTHQYTYAGNTDAFLVNFNPSGVRQWGTFYGGSGIENGYSCATDNSENVYMAGVSSTSVGTSIASAGSHQSAYGGGTTTSVHVPFSDAFLVKFDDCLPPTIAVNSGVICAGESFTINPTGANTYTIQGGNAVVSPSINTTYTVKGTNAVGCLSETVTSSVNVFPCVGINNQNMDLSGVSIYPNPNNGEFTIKLVSANNTHITITNVLGQIIKTQKAELINQINLNLFEKGVYFISVMDNNQSVYRGSIIKE